MGPVGGGRLATLPKPVQERLGIAPSAAAALALRFVLSNPHVSCALSGMGTTEMVDQNVAAASGDPLSSEEHATLVSLTGELDELAALYCTGCNYCAPCPHGVSIAKRFELMNAHRVWGLTDYAKRGYRALLAKDSEGTCQECGVCLDKCPQNIPIIEQLKETHAALGED